MPMIVVKHRLFTRNRAGGSVVGRLEQQIGHLGVSCRLGSLPQALAGNLGLSARILRPVPSECAPLRTADRGFGSS